MKRLAILVTSVLVLAACGGGGGNTATTQVITNNWEKFFSSQNTVAGRVALLQDGSRFKSAITSLASNPLASQLSAKVSSVKVDGNTAKVVYSIYLGKNAVLKDETGTAYKQHGTWLVGYAGLCKLMALQGAAPAACTT